MTRGPEMSDGENLERTPCPLTVVP
jgi:hypothetical protein